MYKQQSVVTRGLHGGKFIIVANSTGWSTSWDRLQHFYEPWEEKAIRIMDGCTSPVYNLELLWQRRSSNPHEKNGICHLPLLSGFAATAVSHIMAVSIHVPFYAEALLLYKRFPPPPWDCVNLIKICILLKFTFFSFSNNPNFDCKSFFDTLHQQHILPMPKTAKIFPNRINNACNRCRQSPARSFWIFWSDKFRTLTLELDTSFNLKTLTVLFGFPPYSNILISTQSVVAFTTLLA